MKNLVKIVNSETVAVLIQRLDGRVTEVLVDMDDLPTVASINGAWTVVTTTRHGEQVAHIDSRGRIIYMSRLVCGYPEFRVIEYRDGDHFDVTKGNLRIVSTSQAVLRVLRKRRVAERVRKIAERLRSSEQSY